MNKLFIATAIAALTATAAMADGLTYGGYTEYAVEAESFELGANLGYGFANGINTYVEVVGADQCSTSGHWHNRVTSCEFGFDHAELGLNYDMNDNTNIYGKVTLDSDLDYAETVIGVSLQF